MLYIYYDVYIIWRRLGRQDRFDCLVTMIFVAESILGVVVTQCLWQSKAGVVGGGGGDDDRLGETGAGRRGGGEEEEGGMVDSTNSTTY